jgi:hypothetical protein
MVPGKCQGMESSNEARTGISVMCACLRLEKSATGKWLGALPRPSHSSCGAQHLHAESAEVAM